MNEISQIDTLQSILPLRTVSSQTLKRILINDLLFSEYAEGKKEETATAWSEYIVTGGIPIAARMQSEEQKVTYLKNLVNETYLKDIIQRNGIRKKKELSDCFDIFSSMIGTPLNPPKVANIFKSLGY